MDAGLKLKRTREKLGLRYRQVLDASERIAANHNNNPDFIVGLSRLADIENKGVIPSIHRLYSICAIYRLDLTEVLGWYGVSLAGIWKDSDSSSPPATHLLRIKHGARDTAPLPLKLDPGFDLSQTMDLTRLIQQWGRVPLSLLDNLNIDSYRYAYIGTEDLMMYPLLRPGSLLQIDEGKREILASGWSHESQRPIYFFELRDGYRCCWCSLNGQQLILQPHSGSPCPPVVLSYPRDAEVIGQVVGVAMHLDCQNPDRRPRKKARS